MRLQAVKGMKTAQTALQQIKDRKYPDAIADYTGNILMVGINYDKDTKIHDCTIEKFERNENPLPPAVCSPHGRRVSFLMTANKATILHS